MANLSSLTLVVQIFVAYTQGNCYFPNGTDRNVAYGSQAYSPCTSAGNVSMCCAEWDTCLDNGLCQNNIDERIWRESCTDQSWQSQKCLKLCLSGLGKNYSSSASESSSQIVPWRATDVIVTQCDDGSWCCGQDANASDCCIQGDGLWIENGIVTNAKPPNRTAPPPLTTPGTPTLITPTSPSKPTETLIGSTPGSTAHGPRTIGIVSGVLGIALILVGFVGFSIGRRRRCWSKAKWVRGRRQSSEMQYEDQPRELEANKHCPELDAAFEAPIIELEQPHYISELDGKSPK